MQQYKRARKSSSEPLDETRRSFLTQLLGVILQKLKWEEEADPDDEDEDDKDDVEIDEEDAASTSSEDDGKLWRTRRTLRKSVSCA